MRPPPRKKPTSVDEIGRVLRIFDLLSDEFLQRYNSDELTHLLPDASARLLVAERIAARTED